MKKRVTSVLLSLMILVASVVAIGSDSNAASTGWVWSDTANNWWYDLDGTYAHGWREIDGYWYYFLDSGYMDYSEYRDGCWLNADGTWNTAYSGGYWASDSKGWWYTDASGWYPVSTWLWIDGNCYYFKANGYMAVNETIDGYYVDASGKMTSNSDTSSNGTHTHTWVCTKDAWDEQVPKYESVKHRVCCDCGYDFGPIGVSAGACPTCGNWDCTTKWVDELVGYDTVHHDAEYTCSTCGATK